MESVPANHVWTTEESHLAVWFTGRRQCEIGDPAQLSADNHQQMIMLKPLKHYLSLFLDHDQQSIITNTNHS